MFALALLAEAAAVAPEAATPAWVTTLLGVATVVLGVLKALDASRVAQLQGALRRTKEGLRVVASVLDRLDGDEDPQEIKAAIRAESTAAGTEPVIKATLAEIRGVAPKPPGGAPGLNGVVPALLLILALGSGCVSREVHDTAAKAQGTAKLVAEKTQRLRLVTVPAPTYDARGKAAVAALGDELEASIAELARALAAIEEASR